MANAGPLGAAPRPLKNLARNHRVACAALAVAVLLLHASAHGDVIYHKNGQKIEGVILSETDDRVIIRVAAGELPLPRSLILRIEKEDPVANAGLRVDAAFRNNNVIGGMKAIIDAHELGADPAILEETIIRNRASIIRGLQALRETDRIEARHQVRRLETLPGTTPEKEVVLAEAYLELDLPLAASDALQRAGFEWLNEDEAKRQWASKFLRELVRKLALQSRYHEAIEQVERLRLLDGDMAGAQLPLIHLTAAAQQRESGLYEESFSTINEHLWPAFPEIARDRSLVTLRRLTAWAEETGNERLARIIIREQLLQHLPLEGLAAGRQLYKTEASRQIRNNHPTDALQVLEEIPAEERTPELQKLWALATFYSNKPEAALEGPPAMFELAQWAADQELFEESILALEELRNNEIIRPIAEEQITLLRRERDMALLGEAIDLYNKGLMEEVAERCTEILKNPNRESGVALEAQELLDLAHQDMIVEQNNRPYVAESYYQQAERAYFTDDIDKAWDLIDLILTHYQDTPAADRALTLMPDVMRQLEIQLLEGRRRLVPDFDSAVSKNELRRSEQLDKEIQTLLLSLQ